jgi:hypothetical protein
MTTETTGTHAGHADILRESLDGSKTMRGSRRARSLPKPCARLAFSTLRRCERWSAPSPVLSPSD